MHKLANIIVENQDRAKEFPSLYCKTDSFVSAEEKMNKIKCHGAGKYNFLTYFNALSLNKWVEYASIDNLHLHLEISGTKGVIRRVFADQFSLFTEYYDDTVVSLMLVKD